MGNKHEGNVYDHEGNIDVEATIEERRFYGNPVRYIAPGADKKWRARDLLDIHWKLMGIKCPESFKSAAPDNDMSDDAGHYAVRLNLKDRISKKESHPKGAHPPSASDAPYFEGKEGAYRKETDVIPSAQPLPLKDCR